MCLYKLADFPPCTVGWQVKRWSEYVAENGKRERCYHAIYHDWDVIQFVGEPCRTRPDLKLIPVDSRRNQIYKPGFHVFHNKEDAEAYRISQEIMSAKLNEKVVKVAIADPIVTGYQEIERSGSIAFAPVTVCDEITILKEEK